MEVEENSKSQIICYSKIYVVHIDINLSPEKIKEIMDLYKCYHKKIGLIKVTILEKKRKLT